MKAVCEKYASNSIPPTGFSCSVSYRLQICNENSFTDRCVKRLVTLLSYYARLWSLKVQALYTSR